jgi:hypothetical protein
VTLPEACVRAVFEASQSVPELTEAAAAVADRLHDRSMGELIRSVRGLTDEQIAAIAIHQRREGLRFGEAAVALNFASDDDVVWALSQQFHYPYTPSASEHRNPELVVRCTGRDRARPVRPAHARYDAAGRTARRALPRQP